MFINKRKGRIEYCFNSAKHVKPKSHTGIFSAASFCWCCDAGHAHTVQRSYINLH